MKINNLNTIYKTKPKDAHAVNGLDLEIKEGETVDCRRNRAGKTTTALSIMGLLPERTGRIIDGEIYYKGENLLKKIDGKCVRSAVLKYQWYFKIL